MSASPAVRAVLLDALGTLVELQPPAPRLRHQLAARFGAEVSLAEAEVAIAAEIGYYRAHLNEGRDADALGELRLRCARTLRDALPWPARAAVPEGTALVETLLASLHFEPFPDAVVALPRLRSGGRRLVVVSNWDVSLHELLRRRGLAELLDGAVSSAEVGCAKPATAIFQRALALAQVAPSQAMHVGDTPASDVDGALAAGIAPVLLVRKSTAPVQATRGVPVIRSLSELLP